MAGADVRSLSGETFDAAVSAGVTLVDFWAPWCMPCQMLKPVLGHIAEAFDGRARVATVDTDANGPIAERFSINAVPTLIVFSNGEPTRRFVGITSFERLAAAIEEQLGASGAATG